jgi:hypothetical protein
VGLPSELVDLIRDGRLHDARHTAATPLLILGVPERAVMGLMGWSTTAMAARHQHITGSIRGDVAQRVGGPIRGSRAAGGTATGPNDEAGRAIVLRTRPHLRRMGDSNPRGREPNTLSKSDGRRSRRAIPVLTSGPRPAVLGDGALRTLANETASETATAGRCDP